MKNLIVALSLLICSISYAIKVTPKGTGWIGGVPRMNYIGLRIDAGVPDGLGFSLSFRPFKFLQFDLGGTTTLVGGGIRGGATLALFYWVSPTLTVEGGRQWGGDLNKLVTMFGGSDPKIDLIKNVQYDYLNLHGGLAFGHPNWFMFYIRAGYSFLAMQTSGFQSFIQKESNDTSITTKELNINAWIPTAKLGFQIWF
jgi:hypothetical protein